MPAPVPACQGTGVSGMCVLPSGGRRDASHALPLPAVGINSTHQSEKKRKKNPIMGNHFIVREKSCQTLLCYGKDKTILSLSLYSSISEAEMNVSEGYNMT